MTSIAYTNLRKEPGMDVLPRWVELVRSDKKRAARMTGQELKREILHRKLIGRAMPMWDSDGRAHYLPFERHISRFPATGRISRFPELPF